MEDVAWFCAKCWRVGLDNRDAGGIGSRTAFYDAYENASNRNIDHQARRRVHAVQLRVGQLVVDRPAHQYLDFRSIRDRHTLNLQFHIHAHRL